AEGDQQALQETMDEPRVHLMTSKRYARKEGFNPGAIRRDNGLSAKPPHPALRATFSPRGEGKRGAGDLPLLPSGEKVPAGG
ncbi:hypothetical protein, partial [Brevundimonas aurantiaca]|uniref:hypothetical protein n=1 Tax=Brevundimonas aurantiaca TaxID=74316 RepID=UPI00403339DB